MKIESRIKAKPKTMDEYIASLSTDQQAALERLRAIIRAAVPESEECISYQIPAFRLNGKCFVWLGAAATHCAIYGLVRTDWDELKHYDTSGKGTVRFQADAPLPAALVRKLVKAQIAAIAARQRHSADGAGQAAQRSR
jgi:uncharacterized protein YdhG (YjbR/CyaY superfamily)